ncbi:MAG: IS66 family transposase [Parasporobacterium sp.]|nr:IS66 family transposase [Parasporobacterium sp.]
MDKNVLVDMYISLQEQIAAQTEETKALRLQIEKLTEQIALMNSRAFSRKTEKKLTGEGEQLSFLDDVLNEAEATCRGQTMIEPEMDQVVVSEHTRRKRRGKREEDLSGYPVVIVEHALSEDELQEKFPEGYSRLPDEVYKKLEIIPETFEVHEHHIAVYKGKNGVIAKGEHPKEMLNNSIATPSLVAAIINAKYTNALPLYRQEQEYARKDVNISRQTMSNWVIRTAERHLSLVYDKLKCEIQKSHVIHADETPVMVTKDGREGMHKNYMWVYRTGNMCKAKPAILYEYQKTRKADAPRAFLKDFDGKLICDGYSAYHALENEADTKFQVAGCWVHARRPFAQIVKSLGEEKAAGTVAYEALVQIQNICHTDKLLKKLPPSKRKEQRRKLVKPLVELAPLAVVKGE